MSKESKGATTIRRRKLRHSHGDLAQARTSRPNSPIPSDDETVEVDEEDEGYLFDEEVLGPSVIKKIMMTEKTLVLSLIMFRVVNALLIQTHFVPDEYWQSLEVAHNMVFDYGYLTWEWRHGLRGYLYPTSFAVLYKLLAVLGMDNRLLLIKLPKVLQAIFAAWGDLYIYKLSWKLSDRATAQWTLFCQVVSWFMLYCNTRTLTNSMETVLVTMALYHYPWPGKGGSSTVKFLVLAALSVLIRPTAAVIWLLMCSWHVQENSQKLKNVIKLYLVIGSTSLMLATVVDRLFHGNWICVQYNFLEFNVLKGGGSIYGTHPWHWYISQGYPVILGTHILPFLLGAWKAKNKVLLFLIIWTVFIYSFLAHKEFRFLLPILPVSMHFCGVYFQSLCRKPRLKKKKVKKYEENKSKLNNSFSSSESLVSSIDSSESTVSTETPEVSDSTSTGTQLLDPSGCAMQNSGIMGRENAEIETSDRKKNDTIEPPDSGASENPSHTVVNPAIKQKEQHKYNLTKARCLVIILLVTNIPVALYFGLIHQRGTILVMKYLHDASEEQNINVLFLMPCHSTPYYSYIHKNITMRLLTCEPNLSHVENYTDEADIFYNDSIKWLKEEYAITRKPWPTHLVYFNTVQEEISEYLSQNGYKPCARFFHSHIADGRVGTQVMVSCR